MWFCGRVVDIQSAIESMKDPDYSAPLAKLKSSLRKSIAALESLGGEAIDCLAGGLPFPNVDHAVAELREFEKTAKRLLAMPKPASGRAYDRLRTMTRGAAISAGGNPGGRRKWRNGVVTAIVHELIEDAGVAIARTGKSIYIEGSPSMKLIEWTALRTTRKALRTNARGVLPNLAQAIVADATEIVTTQT